MNRRRVGDYRPEVWWVREYGGMPGWAIIALSVVIIGVVGVALYTHYL